MHIEHHLPAAILQPFIKSYLIIACDEERVNRILPDTNLTLAFRYKGQVDYLAGNTRSHLPVTLVSGLRKSPRLVNYIKDSGNVLVIFKETGAAAFFREPLHELFEESIPLDDFMPRSTIATIEEQLAEAPDNSKRIALVEQFLLSRLYPVIPDPLIAAALQKIHEVKGNLKIRELAASLFVSQDAFEKRFRKTVGTSPKQFCFIVRMRSITAQNTGTLNFTDIALDAGYFDQPHFNKDFRLFTGQAPTEFFLAPPLW